MPQSDSFFFNDTATTEIYTLSLHDALPIFETFAQRHPYLDHDSPASGHALPESGAIAGTRAEPRPESSSHAPDRSEEHTSELQSRQYLVCRLLLEKKQRVTSVASCITQSSS